MRGEILTPAPNPTYDLLVKPTVPPAQATVSPVVWQDYDHYGVAKNLFNALEATFRKAGGASTYLQLVNMVKIQFTDSMDLLSQIHQFQDNYNWIMSNGHSRLSKDLATFMFCSRLPDSYESDIWPLLGYTECNQQGNKAVRL